MNGIGAKGMGPHESGGMQPLPAEPAKRKFPGAPGKLPLVADQMQLPSPPAAARKKIPQARGFLGSPDLWAVSQALESNPLFLPAGLGTQPSADPRFLRRDPGGQG